MHYNQHVLVFNVKTITLQLRLRGRRPRIQTHIHTTLSASPPLRLP